MTKDWYVIAHCQRENAYGERLPAEWFVLNAPYATRQDAEQSQIWTVKTTQGTAAEWPEANMSAKIVHRDELHKYDLKPLN